MRPLHTVLATAVATAVMALGAPAANAADCVGADLAPAAENIPAMKVATLCLVNQERANAGLAPLKASAQLEPIADRYSADMVTKHFFAHVSPSGETLADRLDAYISSAEGWTIGENIGWGDLQYASPRGMVKAWMASTGHRENILNRTFTEVGVGIAMGTPNGSNMPSGTYTNEFGSREGAASAGDDAAASKPAASVPVSKSAAARRAAKSKCSRKTLRRLKGSARRARAARCAASARAARKARAAATRS